MAYRQFGVLVALGGVALGVMACATPAQGQTLYAKPKDTTPDYASYRHIEECLIVGYRITEEVEGKRDAKKWDTVPVARWAALWDEHEAERNRRGPVRLQPMGRPEAAVEAVGTCLERFNADTATFKSTSIALRMVDALFMADRWADAQRLANRVLDSMRVRSKADYRWALEKVLERYVLVRPVRFTEAQYYYNQLLADAAGDSLYRTIDAHLTFARAAEAKGDTALRDTLLWQAIRTNDATPVEERRRSGDWTTRLAILSSAIEDFTIEEAFDSLAISTRAYNLYRENTVKRRVYGGELVTATDSAAQPVKMQAPLGDYVYNATPSAMYTKQDSSVLGTLPIKGRVNYMTALPSFCAFEEGARGSDGLLKAGDACWSRSSDLRRYKKLYPDLEIILLTTTYGTVGQVGPLELADEADTLAKLFLGHHRIPAHLVIEKKPFFRVEAPDGRRVDLPTPMMEEIGSAYFLVFLRGGGWFTDKEGYRVAAPGIPGNGDGVRFDRFYKILMNRPSQ